MDVSTKTTGEATKRLAVCNLDWDRVTATDLFGKLYTLKRLLHVVCNNYEAEPTFVEICWWQLFKKHIILSSGIHVQ